MIFCLLTFEMPGMGGHELFDRLKEIDSKVKEIIYLHKSNQINYDAIRELYPTLEMECHTKKPINTANLIKQNKKRVKRRLAKYIY